MSRGEKCNMIFVKPEGTSKIVLDYLQYHLSRELFGICFLGL